MAPGLCLERGETPLIAYPLNDSLYLNITNRCINNCVFCIRRGGEGVAGYRLWLDGDEPSAAEVIAAADDPRRFCEVVFCGYGEPLIRLDVVVEVARALRPYGVPVRVDTNGLASLFLGRDVPAALAGLVDVASVSLNAQDAPTYARLTRSPYGERAFEAVVEFIRGCVRHLPRTVASVVAWPGVDVEACRRLAQGLGAEFRVRRYRGPS